MYTTHLHHKDFKMLSISDGILHLKTHIILVPGARWGACTSFHARWGLLIGCSLLLCSNAPCSNGAQDVQATCNFKIVLLLLCSYAPMLPWSMKRCTSAIATSNFIFLYSVTITASSLWRMGNSLGGRVAFVGPQTWSSMIKKTRNPLKCFLRIFKSGWTNTNHS